MNREKLISEVKDYYAKMASDGSQEHIIQSTSEPSPESYYERLLHVVIKEIEEGTFDAFNSGQEIVNAVTKDKDKWLLSARP